MLDEIKPSFDPDLHLDPGHFRVTYKGKDLPLSVNEFIVLQLIVEAPNEVISNDDLIWGLWGTQEPEGALSTLQTTLTHLRRKFRFADPRFGNIKPKVGIGIYWERKYHEREMLGRIGAAKYIYEGYADGQKIKLNRAEHAILLALIKRPIVTPASVPEFKPSSFKIVVCALNQKFSVILGESIAMPGPRGMSSYSLNKAVRRPGISL